MEVKYHQDLGIYSVAASGLSSAHPPGPHENNGLDWIAWHYTKIAFLPSIVASGGLVCHAKAQDIEVIGNAGIKNTRLGVAVDLAGHPQSTVGQHVPFYFAPRSPASFKVLRSTCSGAELVFLGVRVGDIAERAFCCATDGNAAQPMLTKFTRDLATIGTHVDLDVLTSKRWPDPTGEDQDRTRRRLAELLVHDAVPLDLIAHVACYTEASLQAAREYLQHVGGTRHYGVDTNMFMT